MIPNNPRRGPSRWHFDIDRYLNPLFPPSVLPRLPRPVAHFLGYRTHPAPRPLGNLAMIFWAVIGVFGSIAIICAVNLEIPAFQRRDVPTIIGSFGAAAVLDFYAIESPLAQPRNAVLGQVVSTVVGVAVCKLFALGPHFETVRWLGGSLACAVATAVMALTGTVHPPAGATALMAVVDDRLARLGWFLLVPVVLGCVLMTAVAMLVNNVQRRFPYYWWSPQETGRLWRRRPADAEPEKGQSTEHSRPRGTGGGGEGGAAGGRKPDESGSSSADLETAGQLARLVSVEDGREGEIVIRRGRVCIPRGLSLRQEEILSLETLSARL